MQLVSDESSQSGEQVVLVVVKPMSCCCIMKFNVPSGFIILEEVCGKSTGQAMTPGAKWCYCAHRRVACLLSKSAIAYNAPVSLLIRD